MKREQNDLISPILLGDEVWKTEYRSILGGGK